MTDTERRLSNVLEATTHNLTPDIQMLVRGGIERGRRRRRTTAVASTAAVGGLAVAALAAPMLLQGNDPAPTPNSNGQVANDPKPTVPKHRKAQQYQAPKLRELAIAPADIPETFASLIPGEITELTQKEPEVPIVDFLWNGFGVRVGFSSVEDERVTFTDLETGEDLPDTDVTPTPQSRCVQAIQNLVGVSCMTFDDGSAYYLDHSTGPAVDGGVTMSSASLYTADGWNVVVWIANSSDTKGAGPILADDAPIRADKLLEVAQNPVWFKK